MKRTLCLCALLLCLIGTVGAQTPDVKGFQDAINHFRMDHGHNYPRYQSTQFCEIADNIVAYQNPDGGWPKNIDMLAIMSPDSVLNGLSERYRRSTLDNSNIYTQVAFLSDVYYLTGKKVYRDAAKRGIEYMLRIQYPHGGWRGWDVDAITFNDDVMAGVLHTWLDVLYGKPSYAWIGKSLRRRIQQSLDAGIALILKCQYRQNGVRTIWPQQCDHQTFAPVGARKFELPGLSAGESEGVILLLMRIENPSEEIIGAVKDAVAWYERSAIKGKKLVTVDVPEGLPEAPQYKRDRRLVDAPESERVWARFYEADTNRPFMATRASVKVFRLEDVPAERRLGYAWYGTWGERVLAAYPAWLKRVTSK